MYKIILILNEKYLKLYAKNYLCKSLLIYKHICASHVAEVFYAHLYVYFFY